MQYFRIHYFEIYTTEVYRLSPICTCGHKIKITTAYLLHCLGYANERMTRLDKIRNIYSSILEYNDANIIKDLLFENISVNKTSNTLNLMATIDYLIWTKRIYGSIFPNYNHGENIWDKLYMWNSTLWEKFNFYIWRVRCYYWQNFDSGMRTGH